MAIDIPTARVATPQYVLGVDKGQYVLCPVNTDLRGGSTDTQYGLAIGTVTEGDPNAGVVSGTVTVVTPLDQTDGEVSILGLSDLGNPGEYMAVNVGRTALEWKTLPSTTGVTSVSATTPLVSTGGITPVLSLLGLTTLGTAGQVPTVNVGGTALTWTSPAGGSVSTVSGTSPIVSSGGTTPAISLHGLTGLGSAGQFPAMNAGATGLEWVNPSVALAAVILSGVGPHAITHEDHTDRDVSISETAQSTLTFAVTATSGAEEGDLVTVYNAGTGNLFATGAISAPQGFKLWARTGETIIARYSAAANAYFSLTPEQKVMPGQEPFFSLTPVAGVTTINGHGIGAFTALDGCTPTLRVPSATDTFTHRQRVQAVGTASTAGRLAGWTYNPAAGALLSPTAAIPYGWKLTMCAGVGDLGTQGFFGMFLESVAYTTGEPETLSNVIGFMAASSAGVGGVDTNMCWGSTTGTTDATLQTLNGGTGFPVNSGSSVGPMYEGTIEFRSDGTTRWIIYTLRNLGTGLTVSGVQTTNLPTEGVLLGISLARGTGGTAGLGTAVPYLEMCGVWCGVWA